MENAKDIMNKRLIQKILKLLMTGTQLKDIFSKSNYSYFSFLPEDTLSFLPIKKLLNDKNLVKKFSELAKYIIKQVPRTAGIE